MSLGFRGPGLSSEHPHGGSHGELKFLEVQCLFLLSQACTHMLHKHTLRNKHIHINIFKKIMKEKNEKGAGSWFSEKCLLCKHKGLNSQHSQKAEHDHMCQ